MSLSSCSCHPWIHNLCSSRWYWVELNMFKSVSDSRQSSSHPVSLGCVCRHLLMVTHILPSSLFLSGIFFPDNVSCQGGAGGHAAPKEGWLLQLHPHPQGGVLLPTYTHQDGQLISEFELFMAVFTLFVWIFFQKGVGQFCDLFYMNLEIF